MVTVIVKAGEGSALTSDACFSYSGLTYNKIHWQSPQIFFLETDIQNFETLYNDVGDIFGCSVPATVCLICQMQYFVATVVVVSNFSFLFFVLLKLSLKTSQIYVSTSVHQFISPSISIHVPLIWIISRNLQYYVFGELSQTWISPLLHSKRFLFTSKMACNSFWARWNTTVL